MKTAQNEANIPIKATRLSPSKGLSKSNKVILKTINPNANAINM